MAGTKNTNAQPIAVRCLVEQAAALQQDADRLRELSQRIAKPDDLPLTQWAHWYALALQFEPDLIVELGREAGNSTCVMTQAANRLGGKTGVKSFCLTEGWERRLAVADLVEVDWFDRLEVFSGDLTEVDFVPHLKGAKRVLLLWDAHGYAVAEHVLRHLMPLLVKRKHLVLVHDLDDNRVPGLDRDYDGKAFWRGGDDYQDHEDTRAPANLGWVSTRVDEAIPILDFCWRNRISLHSAGHELLEFNKAHPATLRKLRAALPPDLLDPQGACHWSYFTLDEARRPYRFPAPAKGYRTPAQQVAALRTELDRAGLRAAELEREIGWREQAIADLRDRVAGLEAERKDFEQTARSALNALEGELQAIRGSRIWRYSGMLRELLERLGVR